MAINRGVLGSQTGSMGGITASNWKGKNVYKQKVPATNNSNSPAQLVQRSKFAALATLARLLGPALRIGYKSEAVNMTEQNVFTSKNFDAVSYADGVATVNLNALQISSGTVAPIQVTGVEIDGDTKMITVNWSPAADGVAALPTDKVYVIMANEDGRSQGMSLGVAPRSAGTVTFKATRFEIGDIEPNGIYVFAKRANSTACSPTTNPFAG